VRTEPEQPTVDDAPPRRRGRLLWMVAAVVAFAVGIGIGFQTLSGGDRGAGTGSATSAPPGSTAPKPAEQPWRAIAEAPLGVESAGTAVFKGKAWVAGGLDGNRKGRADVLIYDPANDTWRRGPRLPEAVTHAALVSTGDDLFVIGGYAGSTTTPIRTVRRLDEANNTWVDAPKLPISLGAGAAAWDGRRIVYAGGVRLSGEPSRLVYVFQNQSWRRISGRLTTAREHLAAASDGKGTTYFLAGEVNRGGARTSLATVDLVKGDTVRKVGDVSTPRGSVGAFFFPDDGACLGGGRDGAGGLHAEVQCIRANGAKKKLPDFETARHGLGMVVIDGSAYALLGSDIQAKTFRTSETLSLAS
jgi:hypothetical protein